MRFSKRSLEGHYLIDHSAGPGLPEDVAIWAGLNPKDVGAGTVHEGAFYTCAHCQCEILKNPQRTRPRGYCGKCDLYICDECEAVMAQTLTCNSADRQIDVTLDTIEKFGYVSPLLLR